MSEQVTISDTLSPEYFSRRLQEAGQFADQNTRYAELQNDPAFEGPDVGDFRLLGEDGLYHEQLETRTNLCAQDNTPYEVLPTTYEQKAAELQSAQMQLATITDQEDSRRSRLQAAAKRVGELAPNTKDAAAQLAREKMQALENLDREGLRERIGQLTLESNQLEEALRISSEPWPIPLVIRDYDLAMHQDGEDEKTQESVTVEDEIPLEPETHGDIEQTLAGAKEFHGQTYHASVLLATYLAERPNIIFMPQQLGAYLYTDESHFASMGEAERDRCISQRIHRLLNQNELVKPMLEEEGYRLQYGYRHYINSQTGQAIQRKRRIYRVVDMAENPDAPSTFEETIDPNLQSEVSLPPVFHNPANKRHGLAAETVSSQEAELTDYTNELIEQLWTLELLPDQADGRTAIRKLQNDILKLPKCDRHIPAVRILAEQLKGATAEYKAEAFEIALWSFDRAHLPRKHRNKDYRQMTTHVASLVETFYESLSA